MSATDAFRQGGVRDPFTEMVGLEYDEVGPERVLAHLEAAERHHQALGIVNGGVYTTVIEVTASVGAFLNRPDDTVAPIGIANATDFIRPHRTGRLDVEARPVSVESEHQLWDVDVRRSGDGELVAKGQVRFAMVSMDDFAMPEPLVRP